MMLEKISHWFEDLFLKTNKSVSFSDFIYWFTKCGLSMQVVSQSRYVDDLVFYIPFNII